MNPNINSSKNTNNNKEDFRDTIVVSAHKDGFKKVFLGMNCWYAVRIGEKWLSRIKFIAVYQIKPISAVTHFASVDRIEHHSLGKYCLFFKEPAILLPHSIPLADALPTTMMSPRYTSYNKLMSAKNISELLELKGKNAKHTNAE